MQYDEDPKGNKKKKTGVGLGTWGYGSHGRPEVGLIIIN